MSAAEITAVAGIVIVVLVHVVASLRFLYRMEARISSVADAVTRVEGELHEMREVVSRKIDRLATRAESILVIQESVRQLTERVERVESRGARE